MTTRVATEPRRADPAGRRKQCEMTCRCPDCGENLRCPAPATIRLSYRCDCVGGGRASGVLLLYADHAHRWDELATHHPASARRPL